MRGHTHGLSHYGHKMAKWMNNEPRRQRASVELQQSDTSVRSYAFRRTAPQMMNEIVGLILLHGLGRKEAAGHVWTGARAAEATYGS